MIPTELEKKGYSIIKTYKPGGQSLTYLVKKGEDVLLLKKPLSSEISTEVRFRLNREVEALKLLAGDGVPKIIDYNTTDEVFILMEFIKGKTISEYTHGNPLPVTQAIDLFTEILNIVERCHRIELFHRDIKPDNILIDEKGDPVIIDFGMCWFKSDDDFKTDTNKEIGNRFLRLPELSKGSNITVSCSDITFSIGLLFYMSTGQSPNILLDENGRKPHERNRVLETKVTQKDELRRLKFIFDRGFAHELSLRFQTVTEVFKFIEELNNKPAAMPEGIKSTLSDTLNSEGLSRVKSILNLMQEAHRTFLKTFTSELVEGISWGGHGPDPDNDGITMSTTMSLGRQAVVYPRVSFNVRSKINKELTSFETHYGTEKKQFKMNHLISESNKIQEDFIEAAKVIANLAMDELNIKLKDIA
jgi:serine/threonine protein kinase